MLLQQSTNLSSLSLLTVMFTFSINMQNVLCHDFGEAESLPAKCPACISALRFPKCLRCVALFSPQVGEIIKIMKAYINMIVKKRCSVKSATSVDSHASIWTR